MRPTSAVLIAVGIVGATACGSESTPVAQSAEAQPESVQLPAALPVTASEPDGETQQEDPSPISTAPTPDEAIAWPTDPDQLASIESRLGMRRGDSPSDTYAANHEALIGRCMADGGFEYGTALDEAGRSRLQDTFEYDGAIATGGCEGWALNAAYPGNFFGSDYFRALNDAYARDEYQIHLAAYDTCMIDLGHTGPPNVEGQNESDAEKTVEAFNQDGARCDEASGLSAADRAADVVALDRVAADRPDKVDEYIAKLNNYLEQAR